MENINLKVIGHIRTGYDSKFGIPRQSGLAEDAAGVIEFEKEFQVKEMFRGLEEFSHIWVLWIFSEHVGKGYSPTVRPPALGGNVRKGVFATRAPFRPNPVAMSCVKLEKIEFTEDRGPLLHVSGPDMLDGTPVIDIKPYVYMDCHPEADCSFSKPKEDRARLKIVSGEDLLRTLPESMISPVREILSLDPRPAYQEDPERIYGMEYGGYEIKFSVTEDQLTVVSIEKK